MKPEQRRLVQESWARIADRDRLVVTFYDRLFEIDPSAERLFTTTNMDLQRRKFVEMLDAIVAAIDEPDELVPRSAALARRHVGYGVFESQYASVGEALVYALGQTLGDEFTRETHDAWVAAYELLASIMRRTAHHVDAAHAPGTSTG